RRRGDADVVERPAPSASREVVTAWVGSSRCSATSRLVGAGGIPGWTNTFRQPGDPEGPMALRPTLSDGLPLSRNPVAYTGRSRPGGPGSECRLAPDRTRRWAGRSDINPPIDPSRQTWDTSETMSSRGRQIGKNHPVPVRAAAPRGLAPSPRDVG